MATFVITGPDGKKYKVTGDTPEGALAALKKMHGAAPPSAPAPTQAPLGGVSPAGGPVPTQTPIPVPAAPPSTSAPVEDAPQYDPVTGVQISGPISNEPPPAKPQEEPPVDWGSLPVGADPERDKPVGKTEWGDMIYESPSGVQYTLATVQPDPNAPAPRPLSEMGVKDFLKSAGNVAWNIGKGMVEGVQAPAKALRGEGVTNAEAMNPGIYMPGGLGPTRGVQPVTPSLSMTGRTGATVAAGLEKVPFVGNVIAKDAKRAFEQMNDFAKGIIESVGGGRSAYDIGKALQGGLKDFVDRTKTKMEELYDKAYKVEGGLTPETPVAAPATVKTLADAKATFAQNPALGKAVGVDKWDAVLQELQGAGATWGAMRQFRTMIGEGLQGSGVLSDQGIGTLKRIYGALTDDMTAAARQLGPKIEQAWNRANDYTRGRAARIEDKLKPLIEANNPERAFELVRAAAAEGRTMSDVAKLAAIKKSAGDAWGDTVASVIDRLGKAKAGAQSAEGDAFSPMTFLTEWNKMSPQAKNIMLAPEARGQLDRLAKLAEAAKAGNLERNMSNTSGPLMAGALGASLVSQPAKTLLALGGTYLTAKTLTNPSVLRMLNDGISGNFGRIKAMARGSDDAAILARRLMVALPQLTQQGMQ